jgi:Phytanoyl-CoA dioxygenase (PhyH)
MSTSTFHLTEQQIAFFNTFGYLGFPGLMADSIDEITSEFEKVWTGRGGGHDGKAHDGKARSCIVPFIDQRERLSALIDDPHILGIATALLGDDFNYMGSDGNFYVGDTGWHSDGWHPEIRHIKIAFYLDRLTRETGCLRVIPGSHLIADSYAQNLQKNIRKSEEVWGVHGRDVPAIPLEVNPGDLLVFNHNTKHAAFGGNDHRRMFTINLCQRYPEAKIGELRQYISGAARFWIDEAYGPAMLRTANPGRLRHMEQVMANDDELPELSRQARETMAEPSRG